MDLTWNAVMIVALLAAILDSVVSPMALSGGLGASSSSSTVTGTTRSWTVPSGNSGQIVFDEVAGNGGSGSVQYSKNGGAFVNATEGAFVTFANSDTIRMRATGLSLFDSHTATLRDTSTNTVFGPYTWEYIS